MKKVQVALLLSIFPCVFPWFFHKSIYPWDFAVYYTASTLVREHQGAAIYGGASADKENELRVGPPVAAPGTVFAQTGTRLGFSSVFRYIYPPLLADMLVPLSWLKPRGASMLWLTINLAGLFGISVLVAKLINLRSMFLGPLALFSIMVCVRPVITCLNSGQIVLLLFLMWTAGMYLYLEGCYVSSAFLFALATAIKLTPLIVVLPLLIWREWKWLRAYTVSLVVLVLAMEVANGPDLMHDFLVNVVPSLSAGIADNRNESLSSAIQLLYFAIHGRVPSEVVAAPHLLVVFGKLCTVLVVGAALFPIVQVGRKMKKLDRQMTLALFAALSTVVSPVAWSHAYTVAVLALVLLWASALREGISNARLTWLTLCTFSVCTYVLPSAIKILTGKFHHGALANLLTIFVPGSVVVLVLVRLFEMRPVTVERKVGPPVAA